ncbi:MAG: O-antigen ligase family protein [Bradyrhizobium sp.]|nr:O-antigen ligase family protein [Bradyrhizobium sp.]
MSILIAGRYDSLSSTVAIVLEFWGAYVVARGFIFGRPAIEDFVKMLKPLMVVVVAFAILDQLAGIWVLNALIGPLVGVPLGWEPEFRGGLVRATSIFPHPILYGAFCAVAAALFIYARQWAFVGLCLFGCVLAMSSAPLLVSFIVIAVYGYDTVLKRFNWRWRAFTAVVVLFFAIIYVVTNNPTSWVISHMTLDPSTGYFREATWDRAFYNIGLSPLTGYGFDEIGDPVVKEFFDNASVDAVWLVLALRFGIPVVPLLLLANISSYYGDGGRKRIGNMQDAYMSHMRTGFTIAVWVLMLAGLTVHYWNSFWLFWGLCLGIRAGFLEGGAEGWPVRAAPPTCYALANVTACDQR